MLPPTRAEALLAAAVAALFVVALLAPPLAQDPAYHRFADTRTLLGGVPNTMDVLSNAGFVLFGAAGLWLLRRRGGGAGFGEPALDAGARAFFAGMLLAGVCSGWYHWAPDDGRLAWDRLGIVVGFAGALGMVAAQRVSARAGWGLLGFTLLAGPASVLWWRASGSLTPYALLQFGGFALALACLLLRPRGSGPAWALLLGAYALAKAAEALDAPLFGWTGGRLSGHTLKHLLAALAGLAVIVPLWRRRAGARGGAAVR